MLKINVPVLPGLLFSSDLVDVLSESAHALISLRLQDASRVTVSEQTPTL